MNKYNKVWFYILAQDQAASELTFESIEEIAGLAINHPFFE